MDLKKTTAMEISRIRKELGITQRALADLINKDQSSVARYETGKIMPPADVFLHIQLLSKIREN